MVSSLSFYFKDYRELFEHIFLSEIGPHKNPLRWLTGTPTRTPRIHGYGLRDPLDSVQTSGDEYLIDVLESHNALQQLHKRNEGLKCVTSIQFSHLNNTFICLRRR